MDEKWTKETKTIAKDKRSVKRARLLIAILSLVLFAICLYFVYVSLDVVEELTILDINWRLTTIVRLLAALLGYIGAILNRKKLLVMTMSLIVIDLVISLAIDYISHNCLITQYGQYVTYLANIDRKNFDDKDCHFVKVFRRRIVENLILVSFYVFYVNVIIGYIERSLPVMPSDPMRGPKGHTKWALIAMSGLHMFYAIYLVLTKIYRSDKREEIVFKKDFKYIFLWTLLTSISTTLAVLSPFALIRSKSEDKLFINYFTSTVIWSTILGFIQFLVVVFDDLFTEYPKNDFFCNTRLTNADNLGSVFVLMIINKITITLLLSLSKQMQNK